MIRRRFSTTYVILFFILGFSLADERVPSVAQIEDYEDDVLKEIFKGKSSNGDNSGSNQPQQPDPLVPDSGSRSALGTGKPSSVENTKNIEPQKPNLPDYTEWTSSPDSGSGQSGSWSTGNSKFNGGINNYNNYNNLRGNNNFNSNRGGYLQQPQQTGFEPFANLIGQGAQTFYAGARQLGQNFGVNPQYELPLANVAAGLFG